MSLGTARFHDLIPNVLRKVFVSGCLTFCLNLIIHLASVSDPNNDTTLLYPNSPKKRVKALAWAPPYPAEQLQKGSASYKFPAESWRELWPCEPTHCNKNRPMTACLLHDVAYRFSIKARWCWATNQFMDVHGIYVTNHQYK